jgi:hypothetical protein
VDIQNGKDPAEMRAMMQAAFQESQRVRGNVSVQLHEKTRDGIVFVKEKTLSKYVIEDAKKFLKVNSRVSFQKADKTTEPRRKESRDIRNPMAHLAGFIAIMTFCVLVGAPIFDAAAAVTSTTTAGATSIFEAACSVAEATAVVVASSTIPDATSVVDGGSSVAATLATAAAAKLVLKKIVSSYCATGASVDRFIGPSNYYNFDVTGSGIKMKYNESDKRLVFLDAKKDGNLNKATVTSVGSDLLTNMKTFTCSNSEGSGMHQVHAQRLKSVELNTFTEVKFPKLSHDNQDVFVIYANKGLTSPEVVTHVLSEHVIPFICETSRDCIDGLPQPRVLVGDSDTGNLSAFKNVDQLCKDKNIRVEILHIWSPT